MTGVGMVSSEKTHSFTRSAPVKGVIIHVNKKTFMSFSKGYVHLQRNNSVKGIHILVRDRQNNFTNAALKETNAWKF